LTTAELASSTITGYLADIFGLSAIYYNTNLNQYEMFSYMSKLYPE
jgi:hypothetical protein